MVHTFMEFNLLRKDFIKAFKKLFLKLQIFTLKQDWINIGLTIKNKNLCLNLLRSTKKDLFETLNTKDVTYNRKLLKIFNSFCGNKVLKSDNETIKNEIFVNWWALATLVSKTFFNITADLGLERHIKTVQMVHFKNFTASKKLEKTEEVFHATDKNPFHDVTDDEIQKKNLKILLHKRHTRCWYFCRTFDIYVSILTRIIK